MERLMIMGLILCVWCDGDTEANIFWLNSKSCESIINPNTYELVELECKYKGPGLYSTQMTGSKSITTLTMDRLTGESHLRIMGTIKAVKIGDGKCSYISAPSNVVVVVNGKKCVVTMTTEMATEKMSTDMVKSSVEVDATTIKTAKIKQTTEHGTTKQDGVDSTTEMDSTTKLDVMTSTHAGHTSTLRTEQTTKTLPQRTEQTTETLPWIVATVVSIAEQSVMVVTVILITYRQLLHIVENARNAPLPLLIEAQLPIQPPPVQPPPQQIRRRSQRIRRAPQKLTY